MVVGKVKMKGKYRYGPINFVNVRSTVSLESEPRLKEPRGRAFYVKFMRPLEEARTKRGVHDRTRYCTPLLVIRGIMHILMITKRNTDTAVDT